MKSWSRESWRNKEVIQHPKYENKTLLNEIEGKLNTLPPLVFAGEVRFLKKQLEQVCNGKGFLLQGGDCAESFKYFNANSIKNTYKILLQMAVILTYSAGCPVVKLGRMAGQFAKPRSEDTETRDSVTLPSYRGDIINGMEFNEESRKHNPERMISAYYQSTATMNLLRAFSKGGFSNLKNVHSWNLEFLKGSSIENEYSSIATNITKTLEFMYACGIASDNDPRIVEVDFYTSHEALVLNYEEALTREDSTKGGMYGCSAHLLWLGERTRNLKQAHIEYLSGIENPIGVKISNKIDDDELIKLIDLLNPTNKAGKLTLIIRMGAELIEEHLPRLVQVVKREGKNIIWSIDPMHGNTYKATNNFKTRDFNNIIVEVNNFFKVHETESTYAGGIHLELTGLNVTECIGGEQDLTEEDLSIRYETQCDPRLNARQSLHLAFIIAENLARQKERMKKSS